MRTLFVLLLLIPTLGFATEISVIGVREARLFRAKISPRGTVGALSDSWFRSAVRSKKLTEYLGTSAGVSSVNQLGSALETFSDGSMNAYGWCYRVDGEVSDLLADEYALRGKEKSIAWFYAYARFEGGKWTAMCVPADHVPTPVK